MVTRFSDEACSWNTPFPPQPVEGFQKPLQRLLDQWPQDYSTEHPPDDTLRLELMAPALQTYYPPGQESLYQTCRYNGTPRNHDRTSPYDVCLMPPKGVLQIQNALAASPVPWLAQVPLRKYDPKPGFEVLGIPETTLFQVKSGGYLQLGHGPEFERRCKETLIDSDSMIPKREGGAKGSLRVFWPRTRTGAAYPDFEPQITIKRSNNRADPITRTKLAVIIARQLASFIEHVKNISYDDPEWKLGNPGGIQLEGIYLSEVQVVSRGSIQPVLWVMRSY